MGLALLQKGTGGALCVYACPLRRDRAGVPDTTWPVRMPPQALAALGPSPCVVAVSARGLETPAEILAFAEAEAGRKLWWAALIGFSRGCRRVHELWWKGADALALVLAEGVAEDSPPTDGVDWTEALLREARSGATLVALLHSYVDPDLGDMSPAAMARRATGWALTSPPGGTTVRRLEVSVGRTPGWRGALVVYSTGSGPSDEAAHREQATVVLPIALAAHVRPLVDHVERPAVARADPPFRSLSPRWEYVTRRWVDDGDTGAPPSPRTTASSGKVPGGVLLVGDSLAQGLCAPLADLARADGVPFHFKGIQGSTMETWLAGDLLADTVIAVEPAVTLVCLGTNDMAAHASAARASALIRTLRRNGSGVVAWIGAPSVPIDRPAFRATLADLCRAEDVRIFDSQALSLERSPDQIHMTPAGYRAWAASIAAWVPFSAFVRGTPASHRPEVIEAPPTSASPNAMTFGAESTGLGVRAARFALDEASRGVREEPAGSKRSPRLDQYRHGLGSDGDAWDAWSFCFTAEAVLLPGEALPHVYSGSVTALLRSGTFHGRDDRYVPRVGDGAVWFDGDAEATRASRGRIGRVVSAPDADGRFKTIEGDVDGAWALREHQLDEPSLVGWLEYPTGVATPAPQPRDRFHVVDLGEVTLEGYVARVVTGEVGHFTEMEALKAQAVAARTFVLRALRDDPALGSPAKPVKNGEDFQVAARVPRVLPSRAAFETRASVALYQGRLILSNYVAGAPWAPDATRGTASAAHPTERFVTYNANLVGSAVKPSPIADRRRTDNRGCLSQNGARELARRGWKWPEILRFFYGDDLGFMMPDPRSGPPVQVREDSSRGERPSSSAGGVVALFALAVLAYHLSEEP